jgi:hypothetical protein
MYHRATAIQKSTQITSALLVLFGITLVVLQIIFMVDNAFENSARAGKIEERKALGRAEKIAPQIEQAALFQKNAIYTSDYNDSVPIFKNGKIEQYEINEEIDTLIEDYYHLTDKKPCIVKEQFTVCRVETERSTNALAIIPKDNA